MEKFNLENVPTLERLTEIALEISKKRLDKTNNRAFVIGTGKLGAIDSLRVFGCCDEILQDAETYLPDGYYIFSSHNGITCPNDKRYLFLVDYVYELKQNKV